MELSPEVQHWLMSIISAPIHMIYMVIQWVLSVLLSPTPPLPGAKLHRPRIAVIGAGITGVASAAHCVGHGFDTTIFEAGDSSSVGGIWSKVNNTSGLQIHSLMYRFFPSVSWNRGYPDRQQIISQVVEIWKKYGLDERTIFETKVTKVTRNGKGKYIINDNHEFGTFDGIIAAVGTCGEPKMAHLPKREVFEGDVYHSSQLDGKDAKGKNVVVIGGGASAVEALEFVAHEDAAQTSVLARSEKWIIPRNPLVDMLLAMHILGRETMMSWIPEGILRLFFYRDLRDLAPPPGSKGLFTDTPMVNDEIFDLVRSGKAKWIRGDIISYTEKGILFRKRASGIPKGGPGVEVEIPADIVIMATGYERPSLGFLPEDCFEENYSPPSWYLQVFPPKHPDICASNCTYVNAIGAVGNYHIGIYTRLLLMYLVDPLARPSEKRTKLWIDFTRWIKARGPTAAFDFFTYSELIYWFVFTLIINPFRWKWAVFVLFGIGGRYPKKIVDAEDRWRNMRNGTDRRKL